MTCDVSLDFCNRLLCNYNNLAGAEFVVVAVVVDVMCVEFGCVVVLRSKFGLGTARL